MPVWKPRPIIDALRRNADVLRSWPRPNSGAEYCRRWRRSGASWPMMRRPCGQDLTHPAEPFFRQAARGLFGRPIEAKPEPFAAKWPALAGHGSHSPFPCILWRSAGTLLLSPSGYPPPFVYRNAETASDVPRRARNVASRLLIKWVRELVPSPGCPRRSRKCATIASMGDAATADRCIEDRRRACPMRRRRPGHPQN